MNKIKVAMLFPSVSPLTGQEMASRLILDLLGDDEDLDFTVRHLAAIGNARKSSPWTWVKFVLDASIVSIYMLSFLFRKQSVIHLNLGQSPRALLVDGLPYWFAVLLNNRLNSVISLHGHLFTRWPPNSLRMKWFCSLLREADVVTVLGPTQRRKLLEAGLGESHVRIVNNTCEAELSGGREPRESRQDEVRILFLSNLIEEKGYKEYLRALLALGRMRGGIPTVSAKLCGELTKSARGKSPSAGDRQWIERKMGEINCSGFIQVEWIPGAYGHEKARLFREADVFVFPSRYAVESQPIVLIEAMASSCAIIASDVGEIPYMLSEGAGLCLKDLDGESLAHPLLTLIKDSEKRRGMAQAAYRRFQQHFGREAYARSWRVIFREVGDSNA